MRDPSILTPSALLAPGGALATQLADYELRPQQLEMAQVVDTALTDGGHAIVEAPTGVGKSFAYLLPAARMALEQHRRLVISTGTIALQEQLIHKDLPVIQKLFPGLTAVLVKGRQNYLSRRRLDFALHGQTSFLDSREQAAELRLIGQWADDHEAGDRSDLGFSPHPAIWKMVVSDKHNCLGRRCPTYEKCFFYGARRQIDEADILIVNHHLYFSDLSLRGEHGAILPPHDAVIFDEAHLLEDIATEHLGITISDAQVRYFLDGLINQHGHGLLAQHDSAEARSLVDGLRQANLEFWYEIGLLAINGREESFRIHERNRLANPLSPAFDRLANLLQKASGSAPDNNTTQEFKAQAERAIELAGNLRALIDQQLAGYVYYANVPTGRGTPSLAANPLDIGDLLKERLFDETRSVILTSATLAADDSDRFLFLRKRLGLAGGVGKRLDTPFDFATQARLLVNARPLDPNSEAFEHALAQWVGDYLDDHEGGAFILFTSYRQLAAVHDLLQPRLERARRFVLRHGDGIERTEMLRLFKSIGNAILFGTSSFWEGVDVPGDALKHVIIAKLPFEMPAHPLVEARHQEIRQRGGNPFMERTVPEAILRLKQGVGRLIRTRNDSGTIVICDHRVLTKAYGRYFINALPEMPTKRFMLDG